MIKDYLKAGYPALCILTYEPYRAEQLLPCDGWRFFAWDCIQGIKDLESKKIIEEIRDPVEAVNWLKDYQDTVLLSTTCTCSWTSPRWFNPFQTVSLDGKQPAARWL